MAVDAATKRLVLNYQGQVAALRARVLTFTDRAWGSLQAHRDDDIDHFVKVMVPVVKGGQRQVAALTAAYLAAISTAVGGAPVRPVGVSPSVATGARGVPAEEVYHRPGVEVWTALSRGVTYIEAVGQGLSRARSLVSTDLQLAKTHSSRDVLARDERVVGYRRVLEGAESCALCAVASTQRYTIEDLMPIHPACNCGVIPIIGDRDPGRVIDPEGLESVRSDLTDRLGVDPRDVNDAGVLRRHVVVNHHGEIGPVLGVRGQTFTGPDDF